MKKVFLTLAVVAVTAFAITACDKDKEPSSEKEQEQGGNDQEQCWVVNSHAVEESGAIDQTTYVWGTRADIEALIKTSKELAELSGATDVTVTYEAAEADDKSSCEAKN